MGEERPRLVKTQHLDGEIQRSKTNTFLVSTRWCAAATNLRPRSPTVSSDPGMLGRLIHSLTRILDTHPMWPSAQAQLRQRLDTAPSQPPAENA